jgi:hypothetical protein
MAEEIKHADVLSEGLLLTLRDGREALIKHDDVIDCAEKTAAFERAEEIRSKSGVEDQLPD